MITCLEVKKLAGLKLNQLKVDGKRFVRLIGFGQDELGNQYAHWQFVLRKTFKPSGKSTSYFEKIVPASENLKPVANDDLFGLYMNTEHI